MVRWERRRASSAAGATEGVGTRAGEGEVGGADLAAGGNEVGSVNSVQERGRIDLRHCGGGGGAGSPSPLRWMTMAVPSSSPYPPSDGGDDNGSFLPSPYLHLSQAADAAPLSSGDLAGDDRRPLAWGLWGHRTGPCPLRRCSPLSGSVGRWKRGGVGRR
uniref:Uncharacterized protein n=1 Tax=Oryza nivara TaxID=4536 RepID=A0A0E0HBS9_ORYNI